MSDPYDLVRRMGDQPAIEGRVMGRGERMPDERKPDPPKQPEPRREALIHYTGPLSGRILERNIYGGYCLDGPAKGTWRVERNHWHCIERTGSSTTYRADWMGYADESLSIKTVVYHLETFRLIGPDEGRDYGFWTVGEGWQIDPHVALFALIDAEPHQVQQARLR